MEKKRLFMGKLKPYANIGILIITLLSDITYTNVKHFLLFK